MPTNNTAYTIHIHSKPIYSVNNKLVCKECISKEDKQDNECFCNCHNNQQNQCINCKLFHLV